MNTVMTLSQVAEYLRCHPSTVYRLVKAHKLPAFKLGRLWRFDLQSLDAWRHAQEKSK